MNNIQKFALYYLLLVSLLAYGYAVGRFGVFPGEHLDSLVDEVTAFNAGSPGEKETSVLEKLQNDMGLSFNRFRYSYPEQATQNSRSLTTPAFADGRDNPLVYVAPEHRAGYRIIVAALNLEDSFWGALLLSPDGEVIHSWNLSTSHLPTNKAEDHMKNLYGVHVYSDGSVIFNMQEDGGGIVKVDACSNPVWGLEGDYHHVISPTQEGSFWSFTGTMEHFNQDLVLASEHTGEILKTIRMKDVRKANPGLHIWDLYNHGFNKPAVKKKLGDMTHGNDIDPLNEELARLFPQFKPGDILVSYATTNLVFVLDPESLKVKWWRVGATDFQHDPDWEQDGSIVVFSNNKRTRKFSDIVSINPATYRHEILLKGRKYNFTPGINGMHQKTSYGTRMITSAQQGWAFEVNDRGRLVFSFVNVVDREAGESLHLADALRVEESYFETPFWDACAQ